MADIGWVSVTGVLETLLPVVSKVDRNYMRRFYITHRKEGMDREMAKCVAAYFLMQTVAQGIEDNDG